MPKCNKDQIINPATGRCVKKTGAIGKKILSMNATNYVDQTLKKKVSAKKAPARKASAKKAPARKASAKKAPARKASPKKVTKPTPTVPTKKDFDNVVVWVKPILLNPREDEFPVNDENIKLIAKSYKDHLTILDATSDGWKFKNVKINEDNRTLSINIEIHNIDHMDVVLENLVPIYDALNDDGFLMISDVWTYVMGAKPNLKLKDTHPEMYADLSKYNPEYLQLWGDDVNIAPGEWVGQRI